MPPPRRDRRKSDEHTKELFKQAIKEWLDEKYQDVGRWTVNGIWALALVGIVYFILWTHGWKQVYP